MANKVDPKELVLNNLPLVGAYVATLIPVVLWFTTVSGVIGEREAARSTFERNLSSLEGYHRRVGDPDNPLFTQQDIDRLKQRQEFMNQGLASLSEVVAKRDELLERWFDKFKSTKPGEEPDNNEFSTEWTQVQIPELADKYKSILVKETASVGEDGKGPVSGNDPLRLLFTDEPVRGELKNYQKKFWIQQACLEALSKGGVERLVDRIDFPTPDTPDPLAPYSTIPVKFAFHVKFTQLPIVLRELLSQQVTMRLTEVRVKKDDFYIEPPADVRGPRGTFRESVYGYAIVEGEGSEPADPANVIKEPNIRVEVALEVYDFQQPAPAPANQ